MVSVAEPLHASVTFVVPVVTPVRVTVNTSGFRPSSAPVESAAETVTPVSLSEIVADAVPVPPTVYPAADTTVRFTVSPPTSTTVSSTGVTVTVATVWPTPNVNVSRLAEIVAPVAPTV